MKRIMIFIMAAMLVIAGFTMTACNEAYIVGISVSGQAVTDKAVQKGTELQGLTLVINYSDGTTRGPIAVEASMISGYDKDRTGHQSVKVTFWCFYTEFEVLVADRVISTVAGLEEAIKAQQDGQTWAILAGEYEIAPVQDPEILQDADCCVAITANGLTVYGVNMPTLTAGTGENAEAPAPNSFITVSGEDVEINGVNLVGGKAIANIVEVGGDNFVLSDSAVNAPADQPKFAGSVSFLSYAGKEAAFKNVTMQYGRISAQGCDPTSSIVLDGVRLAFAGADIENFAEEGYSAESYYWAIDNSAEATIEANGCVVTVSEGASKHKDYASRFVGYLPAEGVEVQIVSDGTQENVAYVATEDQLVKAVADSANYSAYSIIFSDDITWTKSGTTVFDVDGVTISLNGKTLTAKNFSLVFQGNDFTIKDGSINVADGGSYALFVGDTSYTTGAVVENVVMHGGINAYNTSVTLKNCTITGTNYYAIWCDSNAQVTVESGMYEVSESGKNVVGLGTMSSSDDGTISLTINGGEFISDGNLVLTGQSNGTPFGKPIIHAGIFHDDPEAYVAETSTVTQQDGKYIVTVR